MFKIGDKIKLKKHIIKDFMETGKRPYYFNTYGDMDYILKGAEVEVARNITTDRMGRARVQVKANRVNTFSGTWSLLLCDCEPSVVDNRKIARSLL